MRKSLILLLLLPLIFSSCAKKDIAPRDGRGMGPAGFDKPDFGQPKEEADLRGIVKTINGNEVVILKLDRPELERNGTSTSEKGNKTEGQPRTGGRMPGVGGGGMMMGRGMGRDGETDRQNQAEMLEKIKKMSSGEETVVIPVGIQMLKPNPDQAQKSKENMMVAATLEDIKQDKMINIWLDDSVQDRKIASFVLVMR